jgi:DNA-binding transcriptional LysR family regulator
MLDLRRIQVLASVVETGSITGAAHTLGFTVSSVSQQMSALEQQLGVVLFEKSGRGIRPTAAALLLAEHAVGLLAASAAAEQALSDLRSGRAGRLHVVSFPSAGDSLVPPAMAELRRGQPGVLVEASVDEIDGAYARLRAGRADIIVVVEAYEAGERAPDDLVRVHLLDDPYRLLLPKGHRLARRREVDIVELAGDDWVSTYAGGGGHDYVREVTVAAARRAGFTPRIVAQADEFPATQGYVAAGLGVALAPMLALGARHAGIAVRRLADEPPPRHVWAATRPSIAGLAPVRAMLRALRSAAVAQRRATAR